MQGGCYLNDKMIPEHKIYGEEFSIRKAILDLVRKREQVIYGGQAIKKQLPLNLRMETKDYDILTKKPKESAEELARRLNIEFGKKKFKVEQARHKKTFKVKKGKETIVDYTATTKKHKTKNIFGVKYAALEYQKKKLKKILKDPTLEYRWKKDIDKLERIKQSEMRDFLFR